MMRPSGAEDQLGSILLVTNFYPPSAMVAARRPSGLAKYLGRLGYSVTVLTSAGSGIRPPAEEPATEVVRTSDLMYSVLNWRRENLQAWTGEGSGGDYVADQSRLSRLIVPDVAVVTWAPFAVAAARKLCRRRAFDCVITSSGPESAHFAGLALRRVGVPWVADVRDGWGFETLHSWPRRWQARVDFRLERLVMRGADAVTAVTEPIAEDLRRRFEIDVHTITNGYDPEEVPERTGRHELLRADRHSIVHTGRMASSQRSPAPVLQALRLIRKRTPALGERLELLLAGPITADERAMIADSGLGDSVRHAGNLSRPDTLRLQREADTLLLLTAGSRRGEATGKLYEYLGAERPILVLGQRSEAARIVTEVSAGVAFPAEDPSALVDDLERRAAGEVPSPPAAPEAYSYPAIAKRLADVVEAARARSALQRKSSA